MITQTPWIERKFEFNFPAGLFPVILSRLEGTIPRLRFILKDIDKRSVIMQQDKWSVKQQIGHLYDLEELWYGRILDFLDKKDTLRAADMTNKKTHEADHNERSVEELIIQFQKERQKLIDKVINIDEGTASLTSLHPRLQKPMRLIDSLFFVAEHDDHHLAKIQSLLT